MTTELIKIGQLAERAGVSKSTVQYYVREGLLPPPAKKTKRNMAYYRADLVDRIRLIKELQQKRNLPLGTIKQLMKDPQAVAELRSALFQEPTLNSTDIDADYEREDILRDSGLTSEELENLAQAGFISSDTSNLSNNDVAIVHAVSSMRRAGLNEDNGFSIDDLNLYMSTMENLVRQEIDLFGKRLGKRKPNEVLALAQAGVEGTNLLLMALRRKVFLDLLEGKSALFSPKKKP